jgi:hypothetical protein
MSHTSNNFVDTAAFQRAVEEANRRFGGAGVCHGCKRQLKSGELQLVGLACKRGRLMIVASCCLGKLKVLVGCAVWYKAAEIPPAWLDWTPPEGSA